MGAWGINENDGGGESNFIVRTFVNVIMNPYKTVIKNKQTQN
jgi:hypothetical protein